MTELYNFYFPLWNGAYRPDLPNADDQSENIADT